MLEEKIDRLIVAIEALTARLQPWPQSEAAAPQAKPEPAPEPAPAPTPSEIRFVEDLQQPALALVAEKGREALVAVLAKFGSRTVKDTPKKHWAELKAAIEEARA